MITLKSLGYNHVSEESEYVLNSSFAAQLETLKLWQWSIFVLLHVKDLNWLVNSFCGKPVYNLRIFINDILRL